MSAVPNFRQADAALSRIDATLTAEAAGRATVRLRNVQRQRAQDIGDSSADEPPQAAVMSLPRMLEQLVFISNGARVAYRDRPHITLPVSEFKLHTAASVTKEGNRLVPTAELWLQHEARITTHTITFRPGHAEFTTDPEGASALNLWRQRQRPASDADIAPFIEHVTYLVPDQGERERFLSWLAHVEQHPGELPHTHYLMVTPQTGIGRNWLASLLARVWSGATRLGFDLVGSMNSGFNGPLSRRLLVIVDELKASHTGYGAAQHAQALKAMLTTEHRGINPKYGRQHVEFNCARWLMFSQHHDALPLEANDRRVIVIDNPTERRPPEHYKHLYALLDSPAFVDAVGNWLAKRDLRGFNPSEPAPSTAAKVKAVEASMSDLERALIELRDGTDAVVMPSPAITQYLTDCGIKGYGGRALPSAYAAAGFVPCKRLVTLGGKKTRVVALRRGDELREASGEHLENLLRHFS